MSPAPATCVANRTSDWVTISHNVQSSSRFVHHRGVSISCFAVDDKQPRLLVEKRIKIVCVFLGGARCLELSPCNTEKAQTATADVNGAHACATGITLGED